MFWKTFAYLLLNLNGFWNVMVISIKIPQKSQI